MVPWESLVACAANMRFRCQRKKWKKKAPKLPTHREYTEKQLFGTCFFFHGFVWVFFLGGWAANLRSGRLTHDQVCPALIHVRSMWQLDPHQRLILGGTRASGL